MMSKVATYSSKFVIRKFNENDRNRNRNNNNNNNHVRPVSTLYVLCRARRKVYLLSLCSVWLHLDNQNSWPTSSLHILVLVNTREINCHNYNLRLTMNPISSNFEMTSFMILMLSDLALVFSLLIQWSEKYLLLIFVIEWSITCSITICIHSTTNTLSMIATVVESAKGHILVLKESIIVSVLVHRITQRTVISSNSILKDFLCR